MASQNGSNDNWQGFANIRLESQHKKAIKALAEQMTDADRWAYVLEMLDEGYQITFAPDNANDAVIVTLTGKYDGNRNCGWAMSQRHSDPDVALAASLFAHQEIAQRGSWVEYQDDWRKVDW